MSSRICERWYGAGPGAKTRQSIIMSGRSSMYSPVRKRCDSVQIMKELRDQVGILRGVTDSWGEMHSVSTTGEPRLDQANTAELATSPLILLFNIATVCSLFIGRPWELRPKTHRQSMRTVEK